MKASRWSTPLLLAGVMALPFLAVPSASAAACAAPIRYAASSNRVYVSAVSVTLSDIARLCPSAPLQLVDPVSRTWLLSADLILEGGASLVLDGAGGDVGVLLLRSGSSGTVRDVASITAQHGSITMKDVQVRSYDPVTGGPDTSTAVPSGGVRGRAFIRAISYMDGSTPKESRMDVLRSDVGFLGFNGAESYGVSYKARGCASNAPQICDRLSVRGNQVDSTFHHNFMGTYTWGAKWMEFRGNVYSDNVSYGLDPHDDSDHLLITRNLFTKNGNHGFICSQRCNDLTITDNESRDNGHTPYAGPGDDDPSDNQVHGIMLHRGITDSLIAGNLVTGQITGAGIAVFDSVGNVVRDNVVSGNRYGLRFSVGTRGTLVTGNTVSGSGQYAVFSYKGSDVPVYTGSSGRPADVSLQGNTFDGAGDELFKIQDSDRFVFAGGAVLGKVRSAPRFERGQGHIFDASVAIPAAMPVTLRGTAALPTSVVFQGMRPEQVVLSVDAFSTAMFTG